MTITPQREFKGIWIPAHIWLNKDLNYFEKCLLAEIDSLDGKDHCYASNQYFEDFFKEKTRTIQRGITRLKSLGLIEEVSFNGRTRILKSLLQTTHDKFDRSAMSTPPPHDKFDRSDMTNLTPRHIYNNIDNNKEEMSSVPSDPPAPFLSKEIPTEAKDAAQYLLQKILIFHPKFKKPNLDNWARDLDKMNRIDERSYDEIMDMIDWAFNVSPFWAKTCQSADSLRRNYDKMYMDKNPPQNQGTQIQKNKDCAKKIFDYLRNIGESKKMGLQKYEVYNFEKNESIKYDMNPNEFESILMRWFDLKKG